MPDHQFFTQPMAQSFEPAVQDRRIIVGVEDATNQGETVGMQAAGWEANQAVAVLHVGLVE